LDSLSPQAIGEIPSEMVGDLLDPKSCSLNPTGVRLSQIVATYLVIGQAQDVYGVEAHFLNNMSRDQQQAWVRSHWTDFTTCGLTGADFR
jgi:hypothetical protein